MGLATQRLMAGAFLWVALWMSQELLEGQMWSHALVLLPGLAFAGGVAVSGVRAAQRFCGPLFLFAVFVSLFWMLPRSLDASLSSGAMDIAKFATLPVLVGAPIAASWPRLRPVARGFVVSNFLSMLLALGWLYHAAPVRLCNYYLQSDQQSLGTGYLIIALAVSLACLPRLFLGPRVRADRSGARTRTGPAGSLKRGRSGPVASPLHTRPRI